jgi:hypothetical protein
MNMITVYDIMIRYLPAPVESEEGVARYGDIDSTTHTPSKYPRRHQYILAVVVLVLISPR